jgi:hypothetical protein
MVGGGAAPGDIRPTIRHLKHALLSYTLTDDGSGWP